MQILQEKKSKRRNENIDGNTKRETENCLQHQLALWMVNACLDGDFYDTELVWVTFIRMFVSRGGD